VRSCPECGLTYRSALPRCRLDGATLTETDSDPLIGRTIAYYEVLERLGEGGIAVAYRVRDLENDREAALKLMLGEMASQPVLAERFRREALAMSLIRHPNVATVYNFGRDPRGLTYLVMELLRGQPLDGILAAGPIARERAVEIATDVTRGLAAAHALGFVHRDVTPANVMLTDHQGTQRAKLFDFGLVAISRSADALAQVKLTHFGTVVGTPDYVAPEVACGEPATPISDLYSLGVVLYQMLSGKTPFSGGVRDLFAAHLTKAPPPLPEDGPLEKLVMSLLSKKPEARPQHANAVLRVLEQL
jgi:serine/threonine-protein kinase